MVIGVEGNVHVGKTTYIKNNFSKFLDLLKIKGTISRQKFCL